MQIYSYAEVGYSYTRIIHRYSYRVRIIQTQLQSVYGLYRYRARVIQTFTPLREYREILRHAEMQRCRYTA